MKMMIPAANILDYLRDDWKIAHHQLEILGRNDERAPGLIGVSE